MNILIKSLKTLLSTLIIFLLLFTVRFNSKQAFSIPIDKNEESKTIYLTFDDGPSEVTSRVLDILKEKNVKATFFLIGNQIKDFEPVVKRIYDEGHSIGLHSYTHKFERIYTDRVTFIKEMVACQNEIARVVGISPSIIRFPGGSRTHLTKNYLRELHEFKFKIYDWNMETSDGINPNILPEKLFRDATNTKDHDNPSNITLLLHCDYTHKNTWRALPIIIDYYKKHNYEFKTITEATPELYFPIISNP